jgi:DNA mismatch repair ATPase MutS
MCRPQIEMLDESKGITMPFIDIRNGRHPCLVKTFSGDFIPNDICIGCRVDNLNILFECLNKRKNNHFFLGFE